MQKIALLTDSTADTPKDYVEKYNIHVIPVGINYEHESYKDGVDITPEQVYARFPEEVPKTSLPAPGEVHELFNQLEEEGYTHVLGVTIASGLSGTHDLIHSVAVGHSNLICEIVDTKLIGMGAGMVVAAVAEKLDRGATFEEAAAYAYKISKQTHLFFGLDTLDYVYRGGRLGKVAYLAGTKFDIRPVITCDNETGAYVTYAKAHGRKASLKKCVKACCDLAEGQSRYRLAVVHGGAEQEARGVEAMMQEKLPDAEISYFGQITPALVVHAGPGMIGVGIQTLDEDD